MKLLKLFESQLSVPAQSRFPRERLDQSGQTALVVVLGIVAAAGVGITMVMLSSKTTQSVVKGASQASKAQIGSNTVNLSGPPPVTTPADDSDYLEQAIYAKLAERYLRLTTNTNPQLVTPMSVAVRLLILNQGDAYGKDFPKCGADVNQPIPSALLNPAAPGITALQNSPNLAITSSLSPNLVCPDVSQCPANRITFHGSGFTYRCQLAVNRNAVVHSLEQEAVATIVAQPDGGQVDQPWIASLNYDDESSDAAMEAKFDNLVNSSPSVLAALASFHQ